MKFKTVIYSVFVISILFAGTMVYLIYFGGSGGTSASSESELVADTGRSAAGKEGKLLIAYSGDLLGSLVPCG